MKPDPGRQMIDIDQIPKLFLGFGVQATIRSITGLMAA